ncbi:MAG: DUF3108 domain-containing protein [Muribaculaceae bacterium]|nr:DUF3108 domain-containing protein [Muribaculaceae bacterium]
MKKLAVALLCVLTVLVAHASHGRFGSESISYRVMYKWGLINKQAGTATLTLRPEGNMYRACLTAASEHWADKFFMVRDTLNGTMNQLTLAPVFYEKIAHEGNDDKHDTVRFSYSGNSVKGECTRVEYHKGELRKDEKRILEATGTTVDMLTSFYYMRALPFENWKPGHKEVISIFSGKQKETLTFWYRGIEPVVVDDTRYQCYHITFVFTGAGGKTTSDNMDAWITTSSARIPVLLEGKLPVGKVKCEIIR